MSGETQNYEVNSLSYKIVENDTLDLEKVTYSATISILDSTQNSYLFAWTINDFNTNIADPDVVKIVSLLEGAEIHIATSEMGVFLGITNFIDIRNYAENKLNILFENRDSLQRISVLKGQILNLYSSKEDIENYIIDEILQFLSFHGSQYDMNITMKGEYKKENMYGGNAFDVDVTVSVEEIDLAENSVVLRMVEKVDSKQLSTATY